MTIKLECNLYGYAELVDGKGQKFCPQCGGTDLEFISDPLAESRSYAKGESRREPIAEPKTVPEAPSRSLPKPLYLECKSCGNIIVRETQILACPQCGSSNLREVSTPEAPRKDISRYSRSSQPRTTSGYWERMSSGTQARVVVGLIGFILLMSGVGMLATGGLGGNFTTMIGLMVVGFIFLAIASKGEICCSC